MTPSLIEQAKSEGVHLSLSSPGKLKATGDETAINRWLPIITTHKTEIIATLQSNTNLRFSRWMIHCDNEQSLQVACTPPATYAEMAERYADALEIKPFEPVHLSCFATHFCARSSN